MSKLLFKKKRKNCRGREESAAGHNE